MLNDQIVGVEKEQDQKFNRWWRLVPAGFDTLQHFYANPARCEERS